MKLSSAAVKRQLGVILSGRVVGLHVSKNDRLGKKDLIAQLALDSKVVSALHDLYGQCAEVCPADKNTFTQFPAVGDIQYVAKYYDQVDESKRAALKGFLDVIEANETFKGQSYSHRRNVSEWAMKYKVKTGPDLKEPKPIRGGQWYQGQPTPSDTHTRHQREKQGDALIPSNLSEEQAKGMLENTAHPDAFMTNDSLPIIPSIHEAMTDFSNAEPTPDMKWKTSMQGHRAETDMKIMKNQPTTKTSGYRAKGQYLPPVPRYATTTETKLSREEAMVAAADSQQTTGRGNVTGEGQQQLNPTTYMTFGQGTGGKAQMGGVPGTNFLRLPQNSSITTIPNDSKEAKDEHKQTISDADKTPSGVELPEGPTPKSSDAESAKKEDVPVKTEGSSAIEFYSTAFLPDRATRQDSGSLVEVGNIQDANIAWNQGLDKVNQDIDKLVESDSAKSFLKNIARGIGHAGVAAARGFLNLIKRDSDVKEYIDLVKYAIKSGIEEGDEAAKKFNKEFEKGTASYELMQEFLKSRKGKKGDPSLLQTQAKPLTGNKRKMTLQGLNAIRNHGRDPERERKIARAKELGKQWGSQARDFKTYWTNAIYEETDNLTKDPELKRIYEEAATAEYAATVQKDKTEETATPAQEQVEQHDSTPVALVESQTGTSSSSSSSSSGGLAPSTPSSPSTVSIHPPEKKIRLDDEGKQKRFRTYLKIINQKMAKVTELNLETKDLEKEYNESKSAEDREKARKAYLSKSEDLRRSQNDLNRTTQTFKGYFREWASRFEPAIRKKKQLEDRSESLEEANSKAKSDISELETKLKNKKITKEQFDAGKARIERNLTRQSLGFTEEKTSNDEKVKELKKEIYDLLGESQYTPTGGTALDMVLGWIEDAEENTKFYTKEEEEFLSRKPEPATAPASGTPTASPAATVPVPSPMDTTDTSNSSGVAPVTVDVSGKGPDFSGLDSKHVSGEDKGETKGGIWKPEEKKPIDRPYQRPPTQRVPFPKLSLPKQDKDGNWVGPGGENQNNTEGDVNAVGRGPDGNLKVNRMIENAYVPTLRLFFNEGDANIVNRVNNNPTAIQGSRDVWYDMNSYDWETNNEQDNDLYVMNIVDEARRFSGSLDREELMPKMASEATQESYNRHPKEVFSFPADQTIDAASIMLDVRGGAALTPLTEDQTSDTFHDVYMPDWVSIPNNSPWKRFTQIQGTQMSDSYLRDPSKFSSNDAFFDRNENAFIYTTDM